MPIGLERVGRTAAALLGNGETDPPGGVLRLYGEHGTVALCCAGVVAEPLLDGSDESVVLRVEHVDRSIGFEQL